jgi:membrane dipeptidase
MIPGWRRGISDPVAEGLTLEKMADHIDHVCQLAGNARHAAIGSDLDGAFGKEQCPMDLDTIADLQKLPAILAARGYSEADIAGIMGGNWVAFLRKAWS